jgi:hypothetical protein
MTEGVVAKRDYAKEMTEFQIDKYLDAIKQAGTANSAGVFGGIVALYYFKDHGPSILSNVKFATGVYLLGVALFAVAYYAFMLFVHHHQSKIELSAEWEGGAIYKFAMYAAVWSFLAWALGTVLAARILYSL